MKHAAAAATALRQAILESRPALARQAVRAGARPEQIWQQANGWVHAAFAVLPSPSAQQALRQYPQAAPPPAFDAPSWAQAQWEVAQVEHSRLARAQAVMRELRQGAPWPSGQWPRLVAALTHARPDALTDPSTWERWRAVLPMPAIWPSSAGLAQALGYASTAVDRARLSQWLARQRALEREAALAQHPASGTRPRHRA